MLLLPLCFSIGFTLLFMFSDADIKWKASIIFIEALSLILPYIPGLHIPFIVPLLMQAFIVIALSLYYTYQMNLK